LVALGHLSQVDRADSVAVSIVDGDRAAGRFFPTRARLNEHAVTSDLQQNIVISVALTSLTDPVNELFK
jgi:hypothetical protein